MGYLAFLGKCIYDKKTQHSNTDLDVSYHGNSRSFEAFGSALIVNAIKSSNKLELTGVFKAVLKTSQ